MVKLFNRITNRLNLSNAKFKVSYYKGQIILTFEKTRGWYWGFLITLNEEDLDQMIRILEKAKEQINILNPESEDETNVDNGN
jgi:hypothetical protein